MGGRESPAWASGQDERLLPLVTVVPYAILGALVVATLVVERDAGGALLIDLGLCAAAGAWMLGMFTLRPERRGRPAAMGVFFAGLVVLIGVQVLREPWFGLFTPAGYFYAFGILPWPWRLPGIAVVALESGTAQVASIPKDTAIGVTVTAVVLAVNVICMCGMAWWEWDADRKNKERITALEQAREANRRLQATLAENAGLHRQLVVQAREAGVLDERQRMAREIHDTLAQGLIGIVTQLQAAELAGDVPDRWKAHFAAANRLARESLAEARRSVDALRPQPLETAGLGEALAGVAERWSALQGVTAHVATTGTARPLESEAELALLRAAQEALANVARHARATTVTLTLGYLERDVLLEVRDDGRGFDPAAPRKRESGAVAGSGVGVEPESGAAEESGMDAETGGGFGLKAMRERIEGLAGTLRVESARGAGTTVRARVPYEPAGGGAGGAGGADEPAGVAADEPAGAGA
ncbi:sensor histidine kinase [Actinacidiphila reveromycinica]|uniref:sensor histidine kinase n=1 Tax=Actinacidiphila reveromycinica TaxID=659352 RepID=UPI0019241708|nr:sensor histidine kinase [Streptomyces sp. SN-593]